MMIDEPEERYQQRYEEPRLRAAPAVSASYLPDPGYSSAYYPVTQQPPPPGVDARTMDPRYIPGSNTPPTGRNPSYQPGGYQPGGYQPATTRPPVSSIPASGAFTDARGNVVRDPGYGSSYADPRARHR